MYSLTQAGNLTAFAGLVVFLVRQFLGFEIVQEDVQKGIEAVVLLVGIVTSWIGRYRKGDLTLGGFKRQILSGNNLKIPVDNAGVLICYT